MIHKWQQSARRFLGEPVGHVSSSTKRGSWRTTTAHRTRQAEKQLQLAHLLSSSAKIEQRGVCDVRCRYSGDRRHLRHLARMRWRRPTPRQQKGNLVTGDSIPCCQEVIAENQKLVRNVHVQSAFNAQLNQCGASRHKSHGISLFLFFFRFID